MNSGTLFWGLSITWPASTRIYWKKQNNKSVRAIFVWPWKMVSVSVRYLFNQPMDDRIRTWTLRFPAKENPSIEKALIDWPNVLQYDVKAKYQLISSKFYRTWSFFTRAFAWPTKSHARLYPFDKPIKSLYFRSFVVSVLFARFHFKDIRKSLYHKKNSIPTGLGCYTNDCRLMLFSNTYIWQLWRHTRERFTLCIWPGQYTSWHGFSFFNLFSLVSNN